MRIKECKKYKVLPKLDDPVTINLDSETELPSGRVMDYFIANRENGNGIYKGIVKHSGGKYWWIENESTKKIGIYHYKEVFDR